MKLYYAPGACSLAPHIVTKEIGLDVGLVKVDLQAKRVENGKSLAAINPKGYVPVLEIEGDERLTEGPTILTYLADLRPATRLMPAMGDPKRYRVQEMLGFINSEIHPAYGPLFDPTLPSEVLAHARAKLRDRYAFLESRVSRQSAYLFGEDFTVADAYLYTVTNWARHVGFDMTPFPGVQELRNRVAVRPAVQAALRAEGLAK